MADGYISRKAAYKTLTEYYHHTTQTMHDALREALDRVPSADVQPVRHGRWKPYDLTYGRSIYYCTACNHSAVVPTVLDEPIFNYCPNCGCKMDGGKENE